MMISLPRDSQTRWMLLALLGVWLVLFLPNLRTSPNWYGDEGVVMDMSWSTIHGHPRWGAIRHDFLVPNPYQPVYLLLNGTALVLFGNDILVGRALQTVIGLATALVLFWIGTRLRDRRFGFLCALAFLVYPEVVMHYRWVRPHPLAGTFTLATCGFLIGYIQDRKLRDLLLAGVTAMLAVATHPFSYGVVGVVLATALIVNWRQAWAAVAPLAGYGVLFTLWFLGTQPGGVDHLMGQLRFISGGASGDAVPGFLAESARLYKHVIEFSFLTPTVGTDGSQGVDFWLVIAALGFIFFPVARFRKWLGFWILLLMYSVFKSRNNVPMFFYPGMCFVPLMAVGFAGLLAGLGDLLARRWPDQEKHLRLAPVVALLGIFGLVSLSGSLGHFRSKIDLWTLRSASDAEAALQYVNDHTTDDDFVIMPDQAYWLYKHPYRAQLIECAHYAGRESKYFGPITIPRELFWFDCSYQRAKYLVLAYGTDANNRPYGIDAVYWMGVFPGIRSIMEDIQKQKWPVVFRQGEYMVLANPKLVPATPASAVPAQP